LHFHQPKREQRKKGCYDCGKKRHFVEDCPTNKPTPKDKKKKAFKAKALTTINTWDDSPSEDEAQHMTRGHKHSSSSSSHVCLMAQGNIKSSSSSESE